ncbi:MAG TPA: transcriptional regulator [Gammaproteobacteria bacterium]|jgi:Lrp/AsnC family transcriptional regulator|nr:transcriptional regulator [Gammaproteobacteria bacterium]
MDTYDRLILKHLQHNADISVAELAEKINLTANPCWRRLQKLQEQGFIHKRVALLDKDKLNLGVTVFINIRTRHHSQAWFEQFKAAIDELPEIVEFYRMSGSIDYMLKAVVPSIKSYDDVYQKLIAKVELEDVSAFFAMEEVKHTTELPLQYITD